MNTLTIPRKITKGEELVIISRREYEKLFISPKQKKLDPGLEEALEDIKAGRMFGPFTSAKKLIRSLGSK